MANLSFTSSGATPFRLPSFGSQTTTPSRGRLGFFDSLGITPGTSFGGKSLFPQTSTPAANALNSAQFKPSNLMSGSQLASYAHPSTPVKKQTTNNVDGSSQITEYHAPAPVAPITAERTGTGSHPNGQGSSRATEAPGSQFSTFPGILGSLAGTSQAGSPGATQAAQGLLGAPGQNSRIYNEAQAIGDKYGDQISKVSKYGDALAGSYTNGAGLAPISQGLAGQAQNTTANQVQGIQSAESAALAPLDKELTAQSQAQSGLQAAGSTANTQQANIQSGLLGAGGLAQPQLGSIGQVPFSPLDQGQGNILGTTQEGGIQGAGQLLGQFQGAQALGAAPSQGQAQGTQALAAAGGLGQAQGQQALAAAGGMGTASVLQQIPALESASTAAEGIANSINTFLAQNPQLNPSKLAAGNTIQQWLSGKQLADPAYQTLFNYLNEYTNTLAPILGVGGDATNLKTEIAQSFINAQASGQSIQQVLQSIGQLATQKIQNLRSGATGGGVVAGGGAVGGGGSFAEQW